LARRRLFGWKVRLLTVRLHHVASSYSRSHLPRTVRCAVTPGDHPAGSATRARPIGLTLTVRTSPGPGKPRGRRRGTPGAGMVVCQRDTPPGRNPNLWRYQRPVSFQRRAAPGRPGTPRSPSGHGVLHRVWISLWTASSVRLASHGRERVDARRRTGRPTVRAWPTRQGVGPTAQHDLAKWGTTGGRGRSR
jgi:hypothetical protein